MPYKDPEKQEAYNVAYRAERREELNARERERYYEPGVKERQRENRQAALDRYAHHQREWRRKNPKEVLLLNARIRAKENGLPYDLTVENMDWPTHCPVFGIELDYNCTVPGERKRRANYPTIDRRTNTLGYVQGNAFVISHRANRIKSDATVEELEAILRYARP